MKPKDIATVKLHLLNKQNYKCALCGIDLNNTSTKDICLDHCHRTGIIRGVVCRNCNGIEGKIYNLANRAKRLRTVEDWLSSLLTYYKYHTDKPSSLLHPTFKTDDEKRVLRNKKTRERRAAKK